MRAALAWVVVAQAEPIVSAAAICRAVAAATGMLSEEVLEDSVDRVPAAVAAEAPPASDLAAEEAAEDSVVVAAAVGEGRR